MREAFALQKLLTFFQQKYWHIWDINIWNFHETLTNDVVGFEQPGPDLLGTFFFNSDITYDNSNLNIGTYKIIT